MTYEASKVIGSENGYNVTKINADGIPILTMAVFCTLENNSEAVAIAAFKDNESAANSI